MILKEERKILYHKIDRIFLISDTLFYILISNPLNLLPTNQIIKN